MDLETFLFGGEFTFNCFYDPVYSGETFESFESFKTRIQGLVETYGWDKVNDKWVSLSLQSGSRFKLPSDKELRKWYAKYKGAIPLGYSPYSRY